MMCARMGENNIATRSDAAVIRKHQKFRPVQALLGAVLIPVAVAYMVVAIGEPGLRIAYSWNGNHNYPVYGQCHYATLSGWQQASSDCPIVIFFPVR